MSGDATLNALAIALPFTSTAVFSDQLGIRKSSRKRRATTEEEDGAPRAAGRDSRALRMSTSSTFDKTRLWLVAPGRSAHRPEQVVFSEKLAAIGCSAHSSQPVFFSKKARSHAPLRSLLRARLLKFPSYSTSSCGRCACCNFCCSCSGAGS